MKRLIICCDGTWQGLKCRHPTNIEKIAQSVTGSGDDGILQIVYYHEGIGTWDAFDHWLGGAIGIGIDQHIQQAYVALVLNYDPGDEIYLFGFSRGAYTVRCLAGMISRCGLLPAHQIRDTPFVYELYRESYGQPDYGSERPPPIEYSDLNVKLTVLGCFDTVGSLGVPERYDWLPPIHQLNQRLRFHTLFLSPKIRLALHACAIDEQRKAFGLSPMRVTKGASTILEQRWFSGDHSAIGGGDQKKELLANISLRWMLERIRFEGLGLKVDKTLTEAPIDPLAPFEPDRDSLYMLLGEHDRTIGNEDEISRSALERFVELPEYRPKTLIDALNSRTPRLSRDVCACPETARTI